MPRQTAFPGIWVESIKVEKPPFDEKGVVQEFVGRGATREWETLKKASDFTGEKMSDVLDDMEKSVGPLRDTFKLKYNLLVRSAPQVPSRLQSRSVSARARAWARAKNPFEPDVMEVSIPTKNTHMSTEALGEVFDVTVTVTK